ncbi:MAG: membrane dipeptidase [Anaerolineae bacterium]|nr:membrane dipeptidase [Gemmatimonadaceae bacterium]
MPDSRDSDFCSRNPSRREFGMLLGGALVALGGKPTPSHHSHHSPTPNPRSPNDDARDIYRRAIVIDCLATPGPFNIPWPPRGPLSKAQLDNTTKSGITAVNVTVSDVSLDRTIRNIAYWQNEAALHPTHFTLVRAHADIGRAKQSSLLGLILGMQGTDVLGRDLSMIETMYGLGVRVIQLTYNDRALAGDGCLEPANAGLSRFGRDMVKRLNEMRIVVDLSHAGSQTTADAISASTKPVIISHTGCRALYRHPRNQEDRELKSMADRGGVVGIYLMPFLGGAPSPYATADLVVQHIEHALKVCGADHVGIGSDNSITPVEETPEYLRIKTESVADRVKRGISAPDEDRFPYIPDLNHPRRLETIAVALEKRGHPAAVIEKVIGGNFGRVMGEVWGV